MSNATCLWWLVLHSIYVSGSPWNRLTRGSLNRSDPYPSAPDSPGLSPHPVWLLLHVPLPPAQGCAPPPHPIAVRRCTISHEQLTVPWKSNHPAEVDVCLFVLVDTDVHTAVLTVSRAHKKSHHYDGRGGGKGGGYDFYAYGAVQLAVCSASVYFISHTRRASFTLYTHFTITHTHQ